MIGINNMQNSNAQEKSKGILLFAFNNANNDYVKLTEQTIKLMRHNLKLPISIVTGLDEVVDFEVDQIFRIDPGTGNTRLDLTKSRVEWKNFGRYYAYELSPYNETLLLDTDYLVFDNELLKYFDLDWDYLIPDRNIYLGKEETTDTMGVYSLPFLWATIVFFRKTTASKNLFDLVGRVQRNYHYYKHLYNTTVNNYRNDYAFAIADYVLNGYHFEPTTKLPRPLVTADQEITRMSVKNNQLHIAYEDKGFVISKQNLHVMGKQYLQSKDFKQFVEDYCATN
jgi:hypothetical protein